MRTIRTREAGSALILAAVVVIITAGLGAAFMTLSYTQNRATFNASISEAALYIAEAGLEDALNRMNAYADAAWSYMRDNNLSNPSQYTPPTGADFNCFYNLSGKTVMVRPGMPAGTAGFDQFSLNGGHYSVEITPPFDGSRRAYTVTSTGTHGTTNRRIQTVASPGDFLTLDGIAAFGDKGLNAGGNLFVDSYKSSLGTYASQKGGKIYARDNAVLASNGPLTIAGNATDIFGDVYTGPGLQPPQSGGIHGTSGTLPEPIPVPPQGYFPPSELAAGNFNGNQDQTLGTAGQATSVRYKSLSTKAQKTITIKGDVTMYVDGDIDMHGQSKIILEAGATLKIYQGSGNMILNGGSKLGGGELAPYRFQFYSASTGDMTFNGNSAVFGSFYAPHATVKQTGNAEIFGKVVFKEIEKMQGSFVLHFDEDLKGSAESPPKYTVRSWRETLQ